MWVVAEKILEFFPLEELPPLPPVEDNQERMVERLKRMQKLGVVQTPIPVTENEDLNRPGELYRRFVTHQYHL